MAIDEAWGDSPVGQLAGYRSGGGVWRAVCPETTLMAMFVDGQKIADAFRGTGPRCLSDCHRRVLEPRP